MNIRQISHGVTSVWKKSSYSGAHGDCVEVRTPGTDAIAVRDSKNPQGPALAFSAQEWASFLDTVVSGALAG